MCFLALSILSLEGRSLVMTHSKEDKQFNETLKRMMDAKPKPHEEMKKGKDGRSPSAHPRGDKKGHDQRS